MVATFCNLNIKGLIANQGPVIIKNHNEQFTWHVFFYDVSTTLFPEP